MSTLYVNGTIHSTSDPYATALLVESGSVAWVGADDTADSMRGRSGETWDVVDLEGALVVPAFVDSLCLDVSSQAEPARSGIFLSVTVGRENPTEAIGYHLVDSDEAAGAASDLAALVTGTGGERTAGLAAVVGPGGLDGGAAAHLTAQATAAGVQLYLLPSEAEDFTAVISALRATAQAQGTQALGMARHRIAWSGPVDEESMGTLAENSLSFTAVPHADGTLATPVASLLSRAVPVSFGSGDGPADPWGTLRASLEHREAEQRISARSGFTAATRAGLRALPHSLGAQYAAAGRIAPSSPATFGIWAAESLSVQAPDGRVAAWSTDTRAGTPLLPVLEEGTAAPQCLATVVDGAEVYRSQDWT
ncbi:amidohydrolase family protein [Citricoccus nitrophenolicus]|uniref:amidohydrolase family protein n=1 Tax=Citricoccus nitrophenolicus TaxID=863575 RepID=UPI0039B39AA2